MQLASQPKETDHEENSWTQGQDQGSQWRRQLAPVIFGGAPDSSQERRPLGAALLNGSYSLSLVFELVCGGDSHIVRQNQYSAVFRNACKERAAPFEIADSARLGKKALN
jgi:hypothetical protein